jgi:WD40 repeat protein
VKKKRKAGISQKKYFRLTKSPIPELRSSDTTSIHSNPLLFPLEKYSLHLNSMSSLAIHSGKVYTAGLDYKIFGLDLFNMNKVFETLGHTRAVTRLCPFKDLLVSSGKDGKLKYWKNDCIFQCPAHSGGVFGLASNDSFLFTGNETVKIWQDQRAVNEYHEKVKHLSTLGSSLLCTAGKDCKVWDVRCCKSASVVSSNGNFNIVKPWDENSLWTVNDCEMRVRNI